MDDPRAAAEEWERRALNEYMRGASRTNDPLTDQDLWRYIKYAAGGVQRSRSYWDARLSWRENRARFRYLDRGWILGRSMDELASAIGMEWPRFSIHHADDLFDWMQRTRRC